jgi:hypothetical protein
MAGRGEPESVWSRQFFERTDSRIRERSCSSLGVGWHGTFKKKWFWKTEPKFILRMCFGIKQLGKMKDGFGRRSEPKYQGGECGGRGENGGFSD